MFERLLFKKIEVWILALVLLLGGVASVMFGWAVMYRSNGGERGGLIGDIAVSIAQFPDPLMRLAFTDDNVFQPQIIEFSEFAGFRVIEQDFAEDGIILVSTFDAEQSIAAAFLLDTRTQMILHQWVPPVDEIIGRTSYRNYENLRQNYRMRSPFLMSNGDLVFTSGEGPIARIDMCGELQWVIDRHFHHSIEMASNGNLFVPIVVATPADPGSVTTEGHMVAPIRDDGIAEISPEGAIVREISVKDILERHGFLGLLYGVGPYEVDRTHLNDIEPILESDAYVVEGDLVLSLRNLSTVMLYRPSSDEIIWFRTGPWLAQHDVDYQGDGIFSVFGNDSLRGATEQASIRNYSTIWAYDQKDGSTTPYLELGRFSIFTETQGVHQILANGDVFVEEQNSHMLHRVSESGLRWSYVNSVGEGRIGALHWSRYFERDADQLDWLSQVECP